MGSLMTSLSSAGPIQISKFPEPCLRDTVHFSAMDSLGPVARKHQDWFGENDKEIQGLLEEKHQKRYTSVIPAQYQIRLPTQTYVRQSLQGSETCKTLG